MKSFVLSLVALASAAIILVVGVFVVGSYVESEESFCDVSTIRLYGELYSFVAKDDDLSTGDSSVEEETFSEGDSLRSFISSSDQIVRDIEHAATDDSIRGVIVEIDSVGGSPYAGDSIRLALENLGKPSVAVIKEYGASAAYWAASGADWIIAAPTSDVGSIGITGSYLEYSIYNQDNGYTYVDLSSGPFKDTGSPEKEPTVEEKEYLQESVDELYEMFVDAIVESRGMSKEKVLELADGRSMYGRAAKEAGLIDEVGGLMEARNYLEKQLGDSIVVCEVGV